MGNSATVLYSWSDKRKSEKRLGGGKGNLKTSQKFFISSAFFFGLQIILTNDIGFCRINLLVGDCFKKTFFVKTRPLRKPKSETPFPCRARNPPEGCRSQRPRRRLLQWQNQRDNTRGE